MRTTFKAVLAGTAALAIAACTPAETEADETAAETAEAADDAEAGADAMMADGEAAEMPEAAAEAAEGEGEGEDEDDEDWNNPAGPVTNESQ